MGSLREEEIDLLLQKANDIIGWGLKQCLYNEKALMLQFSKGSRQTWLCFSLKPGHPYFFISDERIFLIKNLKKPLRLFLKTHFLEETMESVRRIESLGRVIEIHFSTDKKIRVSFVPGRVNIEAHVGNLKSVFAFKPKDIEAHVNGSRDDRGGELRSHQIFSAIWQKSHSKKDKSEDFDSKKDLKKKQKGLVKMQERLTELRDDEWLKLGQWLKSHQSIDGLPENLIQKIEAQKSFSWNLENAFIQAKKNKAKIEGTIERINVLEKEINRIERGESGSKSGSRSANQNLLAVAKSKGRTIELGEGRLYIGRSGPENLKLLRKAKPWFIWLHIKDFPGAHGIIEPYMKKSAVSEKVLRLAGHKVVSQSLPKSSQGAFEVVYAECRYVRPIKGAKSGQVTYSHEKVLRLRVEA